MTTAIATTDDLLPRLRLTGLVPAPAQVRGSIRLVPLVRTRDEPPGDLRLARRDYGDGGALVGRESAIYGSTYVPHGFVVGWTDDGAPLVSSGGQLKGAGESKRDGRKTDLGFFSFRHMDRMVQRERRGGEGNALRLLPLHVAMEYFLLLHFGGPDIAYSDYSRRAVRYGIGPRCEWAWKGSSLPGFEEALRVFEVREGQVGVLVFVADAFTSAFVTPHPDDYRALHRTLLSDFYGDLIWHYAVQYREVASARAPLDASRVSTLAGLRAEVARARGEWAAFHETLAMGLLKDRPLRSQKVYEAGPFTLSRFFTSDVDPSWENHIGEAIVRRETGEVEYLKTYRLSAEQARRAFLLEALASADWEAAKAAAKLNLTREQLVLRFEEAELGHVFHGDVRAKAQKWRRQLMEG